MAGGRPRVARPPPAPLEGVDGPTEYLFYQTLVGAWPITADRMQVYLRKAVREAKLHTSWVDPDETYEKAVERFVRNAMSDAAFTASVEAFVASLEPAASTNALAQKLLCLTAPGVADVYQGTEIWNRRLVDPDNRVRVDFEGLAELLDLAADLPIGEITARSAEGLPKLRVVHRALQARARRPAVLGPGASYAPLLVAGRHHERVVAFLRGDAAAVVVPRSAARIGGDWAGTAVDLPSGTWHDVLTDATLEGGSVPMSVLTRSFPVALLLLEEAG